MPLVIKDDELYHDGRPHEGSIPHSGRYKWGSGELAYQHIKDTATMINAYKQKYPELTDSEVAKHFNMAHSEYRARIALGKEIENMEQYSRVRRMRDKDQMSFQAIADELGLKGESTARTIYNRDEEKLNSVALATAHLIKDRVDSTQGYVDIGSGVELNLGIPRERMERAITILKDEGYAVLPYREEQATNSGKFTTMKVICPPGTDYKTVFNNKDKYVPFEDYHTEDGGKTFHHLEYPASMDSKRIHIRYSEDGGKDQDGVIEIRRGVPDLSLGDSRYAQVRILVDNNLYLKGMARYTDDPMPPGVDVIFNTNKTKDKPLGKVLKEIKTDDPDNPFGSLIKANGQSHYIDPKDGKEKLSLINKTREEGEWGEWSKQLPHQFLAKQDLSLINSQLKLNVDKKQNEYEEILKVQNPTIRKAMLKAFGDSCDSTAVHMEAAALPRQQYQVILPIKNMKDGEVFAPNYRNGEQVALVRFPHGGINEIPILTVNNNQPTAKKILGGARDAVGINAKVAERLSGADFDGDTVLVIPCNRTASGRISKVQVKNRTQLPGLIGFDPHAQYADCPKDRILSKKRTQIEMGKITNLITDMTLAGADDDDLAAAIRHSMVIIDANKHKLDYRQSAIDNNINALKKKYQLHTKENGKKSTGAATILSRAKGPVDVRRRVGTAHIDPKTGKYVYKEDPDEWIQTTKSGKTKVIFRTQKSTQMGETDDAFTLVHDVHNPKEVAYANYANKMKSMANQARKEYAVTKGSVYNPKAADMYAGEVTSLRSKVTACKKNQPRERRAQSIANLKVNAILEENPGLREDREQVGKIKQTALASARKAVGSSRPRFDISDREWEAIQAGALNATLTNDVINYVGLDNIAKRATSRDTKGKLSTTDINEIRSLYNSGVYTISDIADKYGVSTSTINAKLKKDDAS